MIELSDSQVERFSRQIILPELGAARQQALIDSSATVVCQGSAESLLAVYLAVAGVGRLKLVEQEKPVIASQPSLLWSDEPEAPGELQRCCADETSVEALLGKYNPGTHVEIYPPTELSAASSAAGVVLVLDRISRQLAATLPARGVPTASSLKTGPATSADGGLSRLCRSTGVPLLWGLTSGPTLLAGADFDNGPCWQCVSDSIPPPAPELDTGLAFAGEAFLASILAAEAIKLLAGLGTALLGRPLLFDAGSMTPRAIQASSRPGCQICGDKRRQD